MNAKNAMLDGLVLRMAFGLALSSCALTGKGEPLSVRWFTPETIRPRLTSASSSSSSSSSSPDMTTTRKEPPTKEPTKAPMMLELGRITSGAALREKIAYRENAFEVGFYDDKRWTERPEVFVRRALTRTLFEEQGVRRSLDGLAPILDVEVLSFEEVRQPTRSARVRLSLVMHDDREALLEKTITIDRPPPPGSSGIDGVVQAMAEALDMAADEVAKDVESVLSRQNRAQPR